MDEGRSDDFGALHGGLANRGWFFDVIRTKKEKYEVLECVLGRFGQCM